MKFKLGETVRFISKEEVEKLEKEMLDEGDYGFFRTFGKVIDNIGHNKLISIENWYGNEYGGTCLVKYLDEHGHERFDYVDDRLLKPISTKIKFNKEST